MQQRVYALRQAIAEERAEALDAAIRVLHAQNRPQTLTPAAFRSVTSLPECAHGLLASASEPRRPTSSAAPRLLKGMTTRRVAPPQSAGGPSKAPLSTAEQVAEYASEEAFLELDDTVSRCLSACLSARPFVCLACQPLSPRRAAHILSVS